MDDYKVIPPPTSLLFDVFPIAVYRIVRLHKPPPARIVDMCCGPSSWTLWLEKVGGYEVVKCDITKEARLNIRCDLRHPPFQAHCFDVVMADLPFPFYEGKRYGGLKTVEEYEDMLKALRGSTLRLLREDGILVVKTSDFWHSREMTPGIWIVHSVLKEMFTALVVVCLLLKPFVFSPGQFKRALRTHNYAMIYRRKKQLKLDRFI